MPETLTSPRTAARARMLAERQARCRAADPEPDPGTAAAQVAAWVASAERRRVLDAAELGRRLLAGGSPVGEIVGLLLIRVAGVAVVAMNTGDTAGLSRLAELVADFVLDHGEDLG